MAKLFTILAVLASLLLSGLSAHAAPEEDKDEPKKEADADASAKADAKVEADSDFNLDVDTSERGHYDPNWNVATCFELGLNLGYQPALATTDNVEGASVLSTTLEAKFLVSYLAGTGFIGPSLRVGQHTTFATDPTTEEGVSSTSFMLQPGLYHAMFIGDSDWLFTQNLSMPMVQMEPGVQADVGVTWLAVQIFRLEAGASVSYVQTNLEVGGREANMLTFGPYLSGTFDVWGEYIYNPELDPEYLEERKREVEGID